MQLIPKSKIILAPFTPEEADPKNQRVNLDSEEIPRASRGNSKIEKLSDKYMKVLVLLVLPYMGLYFFFIRPWLLSIGGFWGPVLAWLSVPLGAFLMILAALAVREIAKKTGEK